MACATMTAAAGCCCWRPSSSRRGGADLLRAVLFFTSCFVNPAVRLAASSRPLLSVKHNKQQKHEGNIRYVCQGVTASTSTPGEIAELVSNCCRAGPHFSESSERCASPLHHDLFDMHACHI